MTISPPSKVAPESLKPLSVLASGVDSLNITINVNWENDSFFQYLAAQKEIAKIYGGPIAVKLAGSSQVETLLFQIQPYGSKGYEWVLNGNDYSLKIGNWLEPISRPSIVAEIRSETLWALGPITAVETLLNLLNNAKASFESIKASRIDLCVDILLPEKTWDLNLIKYAVSMAALKSPYFYYASLTGISIGRGKVSARLYDKPLEIRQKSKKFWMYDLWGITEIPEHLKLIRVEVQFRREALKSLGLETLSDFFQHPENLWAYFSKDWLKFQNNPGKHHTQRHTLPFWKVATNGFLGVQNPEPLIRCKSLSTKKSQHIAQAAGLLNSLIAIEQEESNLPLEHETSQAESLRRFGKALTGTGKTDFEHNNDILIKRAKNNQTRIKMAEVQEKRMALGFPCNLPIEPPNPKNR